MFKSDGLINKKSAFMFWNKGMFEGGPEDFYHFLNEQMIIGFQ